MKKRILQSLLLISIVFTASADPIGPTQALKIASAYLKSDVTVSQIKPLRRSATRSSAEADTLAPLYIIDRGEDSGFVIVSGDNSLPEIIGYTESGSYVEEEMAPAFFEMMDYFTKAVVEARAAGAPARTAVKAPADRIAIKPLIESHWKQGAPYNNLAPIITGTTKRAVTGCACTAAAMILHYFKRDLTDVLLASTSTYDKGDAPVTEVYPKGTPLQWDLMLNSYSGSYPDEMAHAVAVLNAALGAALELKYGSSTSGTISSTVNVYNKYFNVSCKCEYQNKSSLSQEGWEERIYNNLINKQPMIYRGTSDSGGGHAIILDGYNPSGNLYHFNMGWGGSSDGYYTLSAEDGVGGYSNNQGIVYDIEPNKPSLKGKLHVAKQTVKRADTPIRVEVTNNGTLDYSGFNIYWSTSDRTPTSATTVSEKNTELKLATDESGEFIATFKPTSDKKHYIYLTDKKYNVLDKVEVDVVSSDTEITLNSFEIAASGNTEEYKGEKYQLLYNTTTIATASLTNAEHGTAAQPVLRMNLFKYVEKDDCLEKVRSINFAGGTLEPGETEEVTATVNRISSNIYYTLVINPKLNNIDENSELNFATADSIIRFKIYAPTLECISTQDGVMTFKGDWDSSTFTELANDASITQYDLTQVAGINSQPIAANPNALFYTAEPIKGYNIVYDNHIEELRLEQGYNFAPAANHTASVASFIPKWNIGQWNTLALPFTAIVPKDYICRRPTKYIATSIREAAVTDTLLGCKPYLMMVCSETPTPITARDITLCMEADTTGADVFEAVLTDTVADSQTLVLDLDLANDVQYFNRVDSGAHISALTGVIRYDSKRMRASVNSNIDQSYKILGEAINSAMLIYEKWHNEVEPMWNTLLLDSIASSREIFSEMRLTTINSIKNAASGLLTYADKYKAQLIDKSNPIDYSVYITNPSFEKGKKDGWTAPSVASVRTNSTLATLAAGIDGTYFLYCESTSSTSIKQVIEDLPKGYYRLTAKVGTNQAATLFANDSTTLVSPHEWGRFYLTENRVDSVWVEDGTLTIGVESGAGWYKADDFRLYYLGAGAETEISLPQLDAAPVRRQGVYDLFGRQISDSDAMIPGHIYIVDGRKVVAK